MLSCTILAGLGAEQARAAVVPEPSEIFEPLTMPEPVNAYRSGDGTPGPMAWTNRADYKMDLRIDPSSHVLSGSEVVTYHNNSPSALPVLWMQLEQNVYREDSRAAFAASRRFKDHTDGMTIERVAVLDEKGHETDIKPLISDTRMQLTLPTSLQKGETVRFRVVWHYTVPGPWGGRTAVSATKNGEIYEIAQFYPRMAVFDDVRGWDTLPYLGDEFYLDYGNFDYTLTVPENFIAVGSGALLNPKDVLSAEEQKRLAAAGKSSERVLIHTQAEAEADGKATPTGTKSWHFYMANTRDVAFVTSPALLWDAAKLDLPPIAPAPGMPAVPRLAMSVYPAEAVGPQAWDRSTSYVKHAIEYFSEKWFMYPWPNAINVGGHGAAMEYPGIVFDGMKDSNDKLFWVTTHELGHGWFPMIVGSNERRHGFMDEGFNTFIDSLASEHFNNGEFAPKHDGEYAPDTGKPAEDIVKILKDPVYRPLMSASNIPGKGDRHALPYFKGAYGLELLRSQILGPERFDAAFRHYIAVWAYRHPTASDFFRLMNSDAGEDLSWFWRGWYFRNWAPDYAVDGVNYVDGNAAHGAEIKIRSKGSLPLPVVMQVTWTDGSITRVKIPTEVWARDREDVVTLHEGKMVRSVVLDPEHVIPELDRTDNVLEVGTTKP